MVKEEWIMPRKGRRAEKKFIINNLDIYCTNTLKRLIGAYNWTSKQKQKIYKAIWNKPYYVDTLKQDHDG